MESFSLHAGRRIHENDRDGLCYVIRYSARGPVSQKRVSRLSDGRVRYETKNGKAVHFSPEAFVKRLAALVPPTGMHLTVAYGVFASAHSLRECVLNPVDEKDEVISETDTPKKKRRKTKRLNWADLQKLTFLEDVLGCRCGGRRKIRTLIKGHEEARAVLKRMGIPIPPTDFRVKAHSPPLGQATLLE